MYYGVNTASHQCLMARACVTAMADGRSGRPQAGVADAMVEPDPVDSLVTAPGVAVAQLDSPLRRTLPRDKVQRPVHCRAVQRNAARLPLAVDADVERDRVMKDGPPMRAC